MCLNCALKSNLYITYDCNRAPWRAQMQPLRLHHLPMHSPHHQIQSSDTSRSRCQRRKKSCRAISWITAVCARSCQRSQAAGWVQCLGSPWASPTLLWCESVVHPCERVAHIHGTTDWRWVASASRERDNTAGPAPHGYCHTAPHVVGGCFHDVA